MGTRVTTSKTLIVNVLCLELLELDTMLSFLLQ